MIPTPENLERLADPADKYQLYPYDDGRIWYLVKNDALTLGEVAYAALTGDKDQFKNWVQDEAVVIYQSIYEVPGSLFMCIYFENAYFLKHYESEY